MPWCWWALLSISPLLRILLAALFGAPVERTRGGPFGGTGRDELNNIEIYKAAKDSVAYITSTVYQQTFFFEMVPTRALGSGFLISPDGRILTNNHVISGSSEDRSAFCGWQPVYREGAGGGPRRRSGDDPDRSEEKAAVPKLGDSDALQVGQKVLAIGNPFGFSGTLTTGVVSSLGREIRNENSTLEGLIQTDAAINEGNSGGPLLDSQGNVIGINTAILAPSGGNIGIGFAMPINRAKAMLEDFRVGKSFGRPRFGASTVFITGDLAGELKLPTGGGLLIQEVGRGSAAEQAGLKGYRDVVLVGNERLGVGGDFITEVDGQAGDRVRCIGARDCAQASGRYHYRESFPRREVAGCRGEVGRSARRAILSGQRD